MDFKVGDIVKFNDSWIRAQVGTVLYDAATKGRTIVVTEVHANHCIVRYPDVIGADVHCYVPYDAIEKVGMSIHMQQPKHYGIDFIVTAIEIEHTKSEADKFTEAFFDKFDYTLD